MICFVRAVVANRNLETISFFRSVMDESEAYAWSQLNEEQMVDSNAGFELGLIGSFEDLQERIPVLAGMGVDRIVCQFDDPMRDAGPFMKRVIRPLKEHHSEYRLKARGSEEGAHAINAHR